MVDDRRKDEIDTGRPLAELAELSEDPGEGFFRRIHVGINRRLAATDVLDLSLMGFFKTFFTYLAAPFQAFEGPRNEDKER